MQPLSLKLIDLSIILKKKKGEAQTSAEGRKIHAAISDHIAVQVRREKSELHHNDCSREIHQQQ